MRLESHVKSLSFLLLGASVAGAQAKGPELPPIRQLGAVTATAKEKLGPVSNIRPLSDGRVLVNDQFSRRVMLFDSKLENFTVVADSTSATANAYGGRFAGLVAYKGDSTLFVDDHSISQISITKSTPGVRSRFNGCP